MISETTPWKKIYNICTYLSNIDVWPKRKMILGCNMSCYNRTNITINILSAVTPFPFWRVEELVTANSMRRWDQSWFIRALTRERYHLLQLLTILCELLHFLRLLCWILHDPCLSICASLQWYCSLSLPLPFIYMGMQGAMQEGLISHGICGVCGLELKGAGW